MSTYVDMDSRRAIRTFILSVVVLGTPLIVGMYIVDESVAEVLVLGFMAVPAISALISRVITKQHITFGRPAVLTLLLALIPAVAMALAYGLLTFLPLAEMTFLGWNVTIGAVLIGLLQASVLAFGEELGWRGYLLPQLRRTRSFFSANSLLLVMWFAYHVPVIFVPGVYSNTGIPMWANLVLFALAISGFSFFVGALWEKHRDVWGATFAHGSWNYLVQSAWPLMFASASPWIMGEFGVVAGVVTIAIALTWVPRVARRYRAPLES
ncbi:MAG: CPBP family intramembrane glutamic endopeptidase [Candidatus Nanopelagicales bacterium]